MLMELVLQGLQWHQCVLYLDDILVFGTDFQSTLDNLELVLQRFRSANLKLKGSKCRVMVTSLEFLGHIVSRDGISCDPAKVACVESWATPTTIKEVRSFCGFCQYYRKHIANFSKIATPLFALTRKHVTFEWTDLCEEAFQNLKKALTSASVLMYPDRHKTFTLDTDASLTAIGACLSQLDENGDERPIAYASKTLSRSQQNMCTTMRELLAIVVFIRHFHHYLYGKFFTVRTDHASLTWLTNLQESSGVLARWLTTLGSYQYEIIHRKGSLHQNCDSLSRLPDRKPRLCKREDCADCALSVTDCVCTVNEDQVQCTSECVCVLTRSQTKRGVINNTPDKAGTNTSPEQIPDPVGTQTDNVNTPDTGTFLPPLTPNWVDSWSVEEIKQMQADDTEINAIIQLKQNTTELPSKEMYREADNSGTL